jgi:thiamine kinase-like enzyme
LLLEDLATAGFHPNPSPGEKETRGGLTWLAHFHSQFLQTSAPELWEEGCYWHLDTRETEWLKMPEGPLKDHARELDRRLKSARFQTLVHGDAKTTNFCWDQNGKAAAVDFQYVGKGCGIRDVALFLDRALGREGCEQFADQWLDFYFQTLGEALNQDGHGRHAEELVEEWRSLYPVAWSDYCRFSLGWSTRASVDSYSQKQLSIALSGDTEII